MGGGGGGGENLTHRVIYHAEIFSFTVGTATVLSSYTNCSVEFSLNYHNKKNSFYFTKECSTC